MSKKKPSAAVSYRRPLFRNSQEFCIEGEVRIVHHGVPFFVIDECQLAELVRFHFQPENSREGYLLGRMQIVISPIRE